MRFKYKIGSSLAALALVIGAVPGSVVSAGAVETGQLLDKGRWPRTYGQKALLVAGSVAATIALVALISRKETPTSP
jgi:hypothetical protein